ncbi:uncharacterized protein LOC107264852 [Cephus cinctus]|uniref:Uncharacterized protein LOC107264852 n=1 Tax=Cephus cinctus TaxID=211228 RepID=A0AAJ7FFC8_CEPCN|nr:uncharacterized protein LOC107264852 [Cephus cinctus]
MTPLGNPRTRSGQLYNESLIRTRNTIERTFGVWKKRFPVLALGCRFQKTDTLLAMIVATAVLHNIARRAGELLPPDDPALQLSAPWEHILKEGIIRHELNRPHRNRVQNHVQNALINGYFQSLIR